MFIQVKRVSSSLCFSLNVVHSVHLFLCIVIILVAIIRNMGLNYVSVSIDLQFALL